MIRQLGILGIVGLIVAIVGVGVIAYVDPIVAAGVVCIIVGFGLVVLNVVRRLFSNLGLGAMM